VSIVGSSMTLKTTPSERPISRTVLTADARAELGNLHRFYRLTPSSTKTSTTEIHTKRGRARPKRAPFHAVPAVAGG
jgi:hypothetical protein